MKAFSLALALSIYTTTTNAFVGLGTNTLYSPDPCGNACFSYFKSYHLECSIEETMDDMGMSMSDMDDGPTYTTSPECMANTPAYLQSVAWCWEIQCSNISTVSNEKFISVWNSNYPNGSISFVDALSLGKPNKTDDLNNDMLLSDALLVNETLWYNTYRTNQDFYNSESIAAKFGLTLIMVSWALLFTGMFYNCVEKFHLDERFLSKGVLIWVRKYLIYPALFKEKCSVPISLSEGLPIDYIPPRLVSIGIAIYYILNIIFCCVPYTAFWEFQWYPHDTASLMYTYVGNRTGILSFANIPVLILMASRNNIYQWFTGWSFATFQHFHKHVSIICSLEAIVHSIVYTIKFLKKPNNAHYYAVEASDPYFIWGIVGTVCCAIMPHLAVLKLRKMSYEVFMFFHYVLGIFFLVGCYYHIRLRFQTKYGYLYWLYIAFAVWGFDIGMRLFRIVRLRFKGYENKCLIELADLESRTIKLTFECPDSTQSGVGSYYFLYFTTIFPFLTSHPFTVAEFETKNQEQIVSTSDSEELSKTEEVIVSSTCKSSLVFYVQCMKGTTNQLFKKLEANSFMPLSLFSMLEGPYDSSTCGVFDDFDFIILLTGGIGNTIVLNYIHALKHYISLQSVKSNNVKLSILHCDRFTGRLDYLQSKIAKIVPPSLKDSVDVELHSTKDSERLDISEYLREKVNKIETEYPYGVRRIGVVCCGPAKFNDSCRKTCVDLQEKIHQNTVVSYITDPFEW